MSKIIRMTPECADVCRAEFERLLSGAKLANGKFSYEKTFSANGAKATLYFTDEAWTKMVMLLQEFSTEVAWHGVASRYGEDEEKNEYLISDILVYPQEVTGSTVEMDTEKYALWLQENDEDERFYNLHMQGHSHVTMAPTPSSVDLQHQEEILNQLGDEDFYIFMIYNKSYKHNIKIYDMKKNVLFEDADVSVKILSAITGFDEFIAGAKSMVKTRTYIQTTTKTASGSGAYTPSTAPYNGGNPTTPATAQKSAEDKPKTQIGSGWKGANASGGYDYYDDFDYPFQSVR